MVLKIPKFDVLFIFGPFLAKTVSTTTFFYKDKCIVVVIFFFSIHCFVMSAQNECCA